MADSGFSGFLKEGRLRPWKDLSSDPFYEDLDEKNQKRFRSRYESALKGYAEKKGLNTERLKEAAFSEGAEATAAPSGTEAETDDTKPERSETGGLPPLSVPPWSREAYNIKQSPFFEEDRGKWRSWGDIVKTPEYRHKSLDEKKKFKEKYNKKTSEYINALPLPEEKKNMLFLQVTHPGGDKRKKQKQEIKEKMEQEGDKFKPFSAISSTEEYINAPLEAKRRVKKEYTRRAKQKVKKLREKGKVNKTEAKHLLELATAPAQVETEEGGAPGLVTAVGELFKPGGVDWADILVGQVAGLEPGKGEKEEQRKEKRERLLRWKKKIDKGEVPEDIKTRIKELERQESRQAKERVEPTTRSERIGQAAPSGYYPGRAPRSESGEEGQPSPSGFSRQERYILNSILASSDLDTEEKQRLRKEMGLRVETPDVGGLGSTLAGAAAGSFTDFADWFVGAPGKEQVETLIGKLYPGISEGDVEDLYTKGTAEAFRKFGMPDLANVSEEWLKNAKVKFSKKALAGLVNSIMAGGAVARGGLRSVDVGSSDPLMKSTKGWQDRFFKGEFPEEGQAIREIAGEEGWKNVEKYFEHKYGPGKAEAMKLFKEIGVDIATDPLTLVDVVWSGAEAVGMARKGLEALTNSVRAMKAGESVRAARYLDEAAETTGSSVDELAKGLKDSIDGKQAQKYKKYIDELVENVPEESRAARRTEAEELIPQAVREGGEGPASSRLRKLEVEEARRGVETEQIEEISRKAPSGDMPSGESPPGTGGYEDVFTGDKVSREAEEFKPQQLKKLRDRAMDELGSGDGSEAELVVDRAVSQVQEAGDEINYNNLKSAVDDQVQKRMSNREGGLEEVVEAAKTKTAPEDAWKLDSEVGVDNTTDFKVRTKERLRMQGADEAERELVGDLASRRERINRQFAKSIDSNTDVPISHTKTEVKRSGESAYTFTSSIADDSGKPVAISTRRIDPESKTVTLGYIEVGQKARAGNYTYNLYPELKGRGLGDELIGREIEMWSDRLPKGWELESTEFVHPKARQNMLKRTGGVDISKRAVPLEDVDSAARGSYEDNLNRRFDLTREEVRSKFDNRGGEYQPKEGADYGKPEAEMVLEDSEEVGTSAAGGGEETLEGGVRGGEVPEGAAQRGEEVSGGVQEGAREGVSEAAEEGRRGTEGEAAGGVTRAEADITGGGETSRVDVQVIENSDPEEIRAAWGDIDEDAVEAYRRQFQKKFEGRYSGQVKNLTENYKRVTHGLRQTIRREDRVSPKMVERLDELKSTYKNINKADEVPSGLYKSPEEILSDSGYVPDGEGGYVHRSLREPLDSQAKTFIEDVEEAADDREVRSLQGANDADPEAVDRFRELEPDVGRGEYEGGLDDIPSRSDIVDYIEQEIGVPSRIGRFREQARGIFKYTPEVIRKKLRGDLNTQFHELGHWVEKQMGKLGGEHSADIRKLTTHLSDSYSPGERVTEAYAEFVRQYLIQPEKLRQSLPGGFYDEVTSKLAREYPDIYRKLGEVQNMMTKRIKADPVSTLNAALRKSVSKKKSSIVNSLKEGWHGMVFNVFDDVHYVKRFENIVKDVPDDEKTGMMYKLARTYRGWHGKPQSFLVDGTFKFEGADEVFKETGESLKSIYQDAMDLDIEKVKTYLVAKHADELPADRPLGYDRELVSDVISRLEGEDDGFREIADRIYEYQDNLLDYLLEEGMLTREGYEAMNQKYSFYVPFYRSLDEGIQLESMGKGKQISTFNPIRRMKSPESGADLMDPFDSIIKNTYSFMQQAERNRVLKELIPWTKVDGMGHIVEEVTRDVRKIPVSGEEIIGDLGDDFASMVGDEALDQIKDASINIFRPQDQYQMGDNVVQVMVDGKPRFLEIHNKGLLQSLGSLDRETMTKVSKFLGLPARTLRAGSVTYNVGFALRNLVRDQFTKFIFSKYFEPSALPFGDVLTDGFKTAFRLGEHGRDFDVSGAVQAHLVSGDRQYLQKGIREMAAGKVGSIKNYARNPWEALRIIGEKSELFSRGGEVQRALRASDELTRETFTKAGYAGREITLDFSKKGAHRFVRGLNNVTAFFNANLQGLNKLARETLDVANPGKSLNRTLRAVAGITIPSLMFWSINKDREDYQDLEAWRKDLYWNIPLGLFNEEKYGEFVSVPKPFELGIVAGTVPQRVAEDMYRHSPQAGEKIYRAFSRGGAPPMIPTFLRPFLETATNHDFFLDKKIVSEEYSTAEDQYNPSTSDTFKAIGEKVGMSPAIMETYLRDYLGSGANYLLSGSDKLMRELDWVEGSKKIDRGISDNPVIRSFYSDPPGTTTEPMDDFYSVYESYKQVRGSLGRHQRLGNPGKYLKRFKDHPNVAFGDFLNEIHSKLSEIRKVREKIKASDLSNEQKLKYIRPLEKAAADITRRAMEVYGRAYPDVQRAIEKIDVGQ